MLELNCHQKHKHISSFWLEESQQVKSGEDRISSTPAAPVKSCFLSFMVTGYIGEGFNKDGGEKIRPNTRRIYFIDEILPWRVSQEWILKRQNRWPGISVAFTPFTPAAPACLCSIKWGLQIYLVISLVSAVSPPPVSARDTLLLFLAHIKLKHLPKPLFGINRPRPNDQIWPFIDCTGIAHPHRDVDKSHVCKRRRQVLTLMLGLPKCEYYYWFFSVCASKVTICCPLFLLTTKTEWMGAMKGGPIRFQDHSDGSWRRLALCLENKHGFLSVRSLSPGPTHTRPPLHSTAHNSPMVVIIVLPGYWHSITLWSSWNRNRSICKFLFLECWMSALQTNWLSKQPLCLKHRQQNELLLLSSTLCADKKEWNSWYFWHFS